MMHDQELAQQLDLIGAQLEKGELEAARATLGDLRAGLPTTYAAPEPDAAPLADAVQAGETTGEEESDEDDEADTP